MNLQEISLLVPVLALGMQVLGIYVGVRVALARTDEKFRAHDGTLERVASELEHNHEEHGRLWGEIDKHGQELAEQRGFTRGLRAAQAGAEAGGGE